MLLARAVWLLLSHLRGGSCMHQRDACPARSLGRSGCGCCRCNCDLSNVTRLAARSWPPSCGLLVLASSGQPLEKSRRCTANLTPATSTAALRRDLRQGASPASCARVQSATARLVAVVHVLQLDDSSQEMTGLACVQYACGTRSFRKAPRRRPGR